MTIFHEYFLDWMETFKKPTVTAVSYKRYVHTHKPLKKLAPELHIEELDRRTYQGLLNKYAETHEKQTTSDWHQLLKACIRDAMDEGLVKIDPTRKVMLTGKEPSQNKSKKFLSQWELEKLIEHLDLADELNTDWMILLTAKTGMRFGEVSAITPEDFDFERNIINISKSWNHLAKPYGGFKAPKTPSSIRKIQIDETLAAQFAMLAAGRRPGWPIFVPPAKSHINTSTVRARLADRCRAAGVPEISFHALRHTHASILIAAGVSISSVSRRLGHANTAITQSVYIHLIRELEDKDNAIILSHIGNLGAAA